MTKQHRQLSGNAGAARAVCVGLAACATLLWATSVQAVVTPEQKCQAAKNLETAQTEGALNVAQPQTLPVLGLTTGPVVTGNDFVCGSGCQALLDDPARMRFKTRPRLDLFTMSARTIPLTDMDPNGNGSYVTFALLNSTVGNVYAEILDGNNFIANPARTRWHYSQKQDGTPKIYSYVIRKRVNRFTGLTEYRLTIRIKLSLNLVNPAVNTFYTADQLKNNTIMVSVGDDIFYNTADWTYRVSRSGKPLGWKLEDKYIF